MLFSLYHAALHLLIHDAHTYSCCTYLFMLHILNHAVHTYPCCTYLSMLQAILTDLYIVFTCHDALNYIYGIYLCKLHLHIHDLLFINVFNIFKNKHNIVLVINDCFKAQREFHFAFQAINTQY